MSFGFLLYWNERKNALEHLKIYTMLWLGLFLSSFFLFCLTFFLLVLLKLCLYKNSICVLAQCHVSLRKCWMAFFMVFLELFQGKILVKLTNSTTHFYFDRLPYSISMLFQKVSDQLFWMKNEKQQLFCQRGKRGKVFVFTDYLRKIRHTLSCNMKRKGFL